MTIQAVFFDMGGTLERFWYTPESRLKATSGLNQILLTAEIDLGLSDPELLHVVSTGHASYHKWSVKTNEELPPSRVWSDFIFSRFQIDHHKLAEIAEDLSLYFERRFYNREMRLEVPEVLDAIRKMGLKIGLISNVNSIGQVPASLDMYQIKHFFNPIVLSSEYGHRKPDPAIFHYAARLANVPASECVYVGDRIARDIIGARKAGFQLAVQIRHNFKHGENDSGAKPDFTIDDMTELIDILKAEIIKKQKNPDQSNECGKKKAFIFDAGDILYYRSERNKFINEYLSKLGKDPVSDIDPKLYALREKAYIGEISQDDYMQALLRSFNVFDEKIIKDGLKALKKDENNVKFFKGVANVLITLKRKGYYLAIVTDTANSLHTKLNWFERVGIENIWDAIISSRDVGVRKPDPKTYRAALEQLGIKAEEAVFVGHKISELTGAKAIGMETIAFNYDAGAPADHYVEEFQDILDVPVDLHLKELKVDPSYAKSS